MADCLDWWTLSGNRLLTVDVHTILTVTSAKEALKWERFAFLYLRTHKSKYWSSVFLSIQMRYSTCTDEILLLLPFRYRWDTLEMLLPVIRWTFWRPNQWFQIVAKAYEQEKNSHLAIWTLLSCFLFLNYSISQFCG